MGRVILAGILALAAAGCSRIEDVMYFGEPGHDAGLAVLAVEHSVLDPPFSAAVTNYRINTYVSNSSTVTAVPVDRRATVLILPPLSEGSNLMVVRVTAEDKTNTKEYSLLFYRMGADYSSAGGGVLKYVPGGVFQRDADPANTSRVSAFRIGRTEVTRAQYAGLMGADPSDPARSTGVNDPVQGVSWYHAIAFCNKLSLAEGLVPAYKVGSVNFVTLTHADVPLTNNADWNDVSLAMNASGYRLPTAMEWMWAALGANMGDDPFTVNTTGRLKAFAGSTGANLIADCAWYGYGSGGSAVSPGTIPAGSLAGNELGLFDMSGNLHEWCWDWFDLHPSGHLDNYQGPASGTGRVFRSGSWNSVASSCAVAYIYSNSPQNWGDIAGFRIVRP